jgi:hypothetical protein
MDSKELARIVAKAIFYSSIQASLGSIEMSSKFSVMNFSKDQETLQRAADALRSYIIIAVVWTVGTILALYASYGWCGAWVGLAANAVMMGWIIISYIKAFGEAAKRYNLKNPTVFGGSDWIVCIICVGVLLVAMAYLGGYLSLDGLKNVMA